MLIFKCDYLVQFPFTGDITFDTFKENVLNIKYKNNLNLNELVQKYPIIYYNNVKNFESKNELTLNNWKNSYCQLWFSIVYS